MRYNKRLAIFLLLVTATCLGSAHSTATAAAPGDGIPSLVYDPTDGSVWIEPDGSPIYSYAIGTGGNISIRNEFERVPDGWLPAGFVQDIEAFGETHERIESPFWLGKVALPNLTTEDLTLLGGIIDETQSNRLSDWTVSDVRVEPNYLEDQKFDRTGQHFTREGWEFSVGNFVTEDFETTTSTDECTNIFCAPRFETDIVSLAYTNLGIPFQLVDDALTQNRALAGEVVYRLDNSADNTEIVVDFGGREVTAVAIEIAFETVSIGPVSEVVLSVDGERLLPFPISTNFPPNRQFLYSSAKPFSEVRIVPTYFGADAIPITIDNISFRYAVPEPSSVLLAALAFVLAALRRRL